MTPIRGRAAAGRVVSLAVRNIAGAASPGAGQIQRSASMEADIDPFDRAISRSAP